MDNVPIYVKVDKYKELLETIKAINARLSAVEKTIEKINEFKRQEDAQVQQWNENLADIRARLQRINQAFYKDD